MRTFIDEMWTDHLVRLKRAADATMLTLRHHLPSTHAADHANGWALFIDDRLVALAKEMKS